MSDIRRVSFVQPLVGAAGAVLLLLFLGRAFLGLREAGSFGRFELARLDVAVAFALLVPAAGLFERARRALGPPPAPIDRLTAVLLPIVAAALVLGKEPGLFMASLFGTIALAISLAALASLAMYGLRRAESARFGAWLVLSSFILRAAFEIGAPALLVRLR